MTHTLVLLVIALLILVALIWIFDLVPMKDPNGRQVVRIALLIAFIVVVAHLFGLF